MYAALRRLVSIAGCALLVAACAGSSESNALLRDKRGVTPTLTSDCQLAERRCTQCHTIERVLLARPRTPTHWQRYVTRMRLMPGARISQPDARRITRCLVYRQFGDSGVRSLDGRSKREAARSAKTAPPR